MDIWITILAKHYIPEKYMEVKFIILRQIIEKNVKKLSFKK
jgi:hypothetical protein